MHRTIWVIKFVKKIVVSWFPIQIMVSRTPTFRELKHRLKNVYGKYSTNNKFLFCRVPLLISNKKQSKCKAFTYNSFCKFPQMYCNWKLNKQTCVSESIAFYPSCPRYTYSQTKYSSYPLRAQPQIRQTVAVAPKHTGGDRWATQQVWECFYA